jgi:hypothetical protein
MDSLTELINSQIVLVGAAIVVALLSITLLFRILKAGSGLILTIVAIVLVLQYGFGISPGQLWSEIFNLPQDLARLLSSVNLDALTSVFSS